MNKKCMYCGTEIPELSEYYRHVDSLHQADLKRLIDDCYGDV